MLSTGLGQSSGRGNSKRWGRQRINQNSPQDFRASVNLIHHSCLIDMTTYCTTQGPI